ncbi:MAG: FimV/HubP family polar landmark protein [Pseudomonadota bacterium]
MHRFLLIRSRARLKASAIIFSFLAAAAAPQSWGLGLGEIELNSALNQEFNATIELFDAAGLEPGEILVSLGSSDDFQRVGVERFFFLTGLTFEVGYGANGDPQVVITSSRPITEPYLNFLVEVLWPNGRLLKEYTVLLDPPTFSEAPAPAVSAPAQNRSAANSGRVQRAPAQTGTRVQVAPREAPAPAPSPLDRGIEGDEYGMTDRGDTLWSIASRARPSNGVSVEQTMLAIAELNPDAFINGNINLMKAGYVLRLPDEAQAQGLSSEQALAEVSRQADEWLAYNRGEAVAERDSRPVPQVADRTSDLRSPVDASAATTAATSAPASDGELRIVAEDGDSTTGVGQGGSGDLAAAREETDRLGMQVSELTYQLDREKEIASNEIAVRDRQIEVKDQQIAELQAQLAAAQQGEQPASVPPAPATTPTQSQNQSTPAEAAAPWWQSPMVMYGGAGALVLLLVAGMMASRKRRAQEEENDYFDAEEAFAEDERVEPALAEFDEPDAYEEDSLDATAEDAIEESFDDEVQESQTSDVIGEADIYIAYGRFPQAIGLLLGVLEDEPERNDVRLKLLEVYAETGDRAAFDQHMTSLIEYCDDEDALLTARELEGQFGEEAITLDDMMAEEEQNNATDAAAADADLGDLEFDTSDATAEADSGLALDVSAKDDMVVPEPAADAEESPAESEESALDFELELDDLDTGEADAASPETEAEDAGAGDQLGGDLGIDFNPDAEEKPEDNGIDFEAAKDELSLDSLDTSSGSGGFGETEELTIDADLEQAAASISGEAADLDAQTATDDGDLALETAPSADKDPLDDIAFESATAQSEDEFDFEDEGDSANTKLDLARAYIDMGDADGARDILKEVLDEGNADQQQKAQSMLESL